MPQRRQGKPLIWLPLVRAAQTGVASLASAAQVTVLDEALDHPGSGEDYGPGAIIGLRFHYEVEPAAAAYGLFFVVAVLPQGLSVPTLNTVATLKQNEKYVWGIVHMHTMPGFATGTPVYWGEFNPNTVRRMEPGDRLVAVLVNGGPTAFAAGADDVIEVSLYIREA